MADQGKLEAATLTEDVLKMYTKKIAAIQRLYKEGRMTPALKKIHSLEKKYIPTKEHQIKFDLIRQEAEEVKALLEEFSKDEGWEKVYSSGDSTCKFKADPHSPTKTLFLDGIMDTSVFNIVAVLIEIDMYKNWVPCTLGMGLTSCKELKEIDMLKKVGYLTIGLPWPMSDRDICVYGYGCDMLDDGRIVCVVRSHDVPPHTNATTQTSTTTKHADSSTESKRDSKTEEKRAPTAKHTETVNFINILDTLEEKIDIPKSGKMSRVIMSCGGHALAKYLFGFKAKLSKSYRFLLRPISANTTYVAFLWNIDPRMDVIPQTLLNWGLKQMSHMCFSMLKTHAKEIEQNKDSPYRKRMEEKKELYDFLKRRFKEYQDVTATASSASASAAATATTTATATT